MTAPSFRNLDEYDAYLNAAVQPWPRERRTLLAAASAERWLPVYQQFSTAEQWGDPRLLRQALDAVWLSLSDPSARLDWMVLSDQVHAVTPHMDDFDANEALCACVMVQYALQACRDRDNRSAVVMGVLSGLEAVCPDVLDSVPVPARQWRQAAVGREIKKQLRLLEAVSQLDGQPDPRAALSALLSDPGMAGEVQPRAASVPTGPTNAQAYEQYRKIIERDIQSASRGMDPRRFPDLAVNLHLASWLGRYARRKQILTGEYGQLQDQTALKLLLEKNRTRDRAVSAPAGWDSAARQWIDIFYSNPYNGMDAKTPESPHGFGPSLRRLWVEASQRGLPPDQAWDAVETWVRRLPAAWKPGSRREVAALKARLEQPVSWTLTGDPDLPWSAAFGAETWQVRLNDFPDEVMYTLLVNGAEAGSFHDWPPAWQRE